MATDDKARQEEREEIDTLISLVSAFHDRDVFLPTRTIFMGSTTVNLDGESGCDAEMAERFIKNMHVLEMVNHDPITVIMNNIGGSEYHGLAIYDAIRQSPCSVTIVVRGHAMSMGSIILQAADERVMGPTATQMIHYGTWGTQHHAKTMERIAREAERLNSWMEKMYLDRIHERRGDLTMVDLKRMLDHDTYLNASQSVAVGLADRVG